MRVSFLGLNKSEGEKVEEKVKETEKRREKLGG